MDIVHRPGAGDDAAVIFGDPFQPLGKAAALVQDHLLEGLARVLVQIGIVGQRLDRGAQVGDRLAEALGRRAQHGVALAEHGQFGRDILEGHDIAVDAVVLLKDQAHLAFQQIAAIGRGGDELGRRAVRVGDVPAFLDAQGRAAPACAGRAPW